MATTQPHKTPWTSALDMERVAEGEYLVNFPPDYCYGNRGHGGMVTSLAMRAITAHSTTVPQRVHLPDVMELKVNWLRMTTIGAVSIKIEDVATSKRSATVLARLSQGGKLNAVVLATMGDFSLARGATFATNWALDPAPRPAETSKMAHDEDPEWVSYQTPWHPNSYLRILSHAKLFFPMHPFSDPTIRDMWLTPVDNDPGFGWTNDHLGYLADMTFSPLESWQGEKGAGSDVNMIRMGLAQKADREAGKPLQEKSKGLSPFVSYSTSMNVDVKKRLPPQGAKWLFTRTSSKQAKDGRMDWEVTIHDENYELVAIVHILHGIIELQNNPQPGGADKKMGKPRI